MVLIVVSRIIGRLKTKCFRERSSALTSLKLDVGRWAITADLHPSPAASARLVQLHGLTSSMARDEILGLNFVHDLPEFETLRYDAPGHGRTRLREDGAHDGQKAVEQDFLWDSLADTLYAVVGDVWPDVTDTRPLVGIGQSMGCATLLTAQVKHPGLFDKLILGLPPTVWENRSARATGYEFSAQYVEDNGLAAYSEFMKHEALPPAVNPDRPHTDPDVLESILPIAYRGAAKANLPAKEKIMQIECPVLILAWTQDPGHPIESAEELGDLLPNAEVHIAETPDDVGQWTTMVREFILR